MGEKRAGDNLRHLCSRCIYRSIYLPSVRNIAGAGCKNRSPSLYTADDPAEYDDIYRKEWEDRPGITKIFRCTIFLFKGTGSRKYLSALWQWSNVTKRTGCFVRRALF